MSTTREKNFTSLPKINLEHYYDLANFYKWALHNNKTLFFPKYENNTYIIVQIHTLKDLTQGHFNILEPKQNKHVD